MTLFGSLPINGVKPVIPPIKCQGIKTRLVSFIMENIRWNGKGRWVEPFLGSGVVLFSVQPERAIVSDVNPHIINFYRGLAEESLTPEMVREHLTREGDELETIGEDHFYKIRQRFNKTSDPLDFLFLSRSCFNGVMRFNKKGEFNVPFCRKPERFRQAYITKIVNQVISARRVMSRKKWEFRIGDWRDAIRGLRVEDFVYFDPPYIGRHTDYFNQWSEADAVDLAKTAQSLPCGFALSMWKANEYRANDHLELWKGVEERTLKHFYHVGSTEDLRHEMEEALLIKQGHSSPPMEGVKKVAIQQAGLFS